MVVDRGAAAIDFYRSVLGATVRLRRDGPGGVVEHAELQIGDSVIMLSDEFPELGMRAPAAFGGCAIALRVYVEDVDSAFERAVQAGAQPLRAVENVFYGDRTGEFEDPFGHRWAVSTHVEDVPADEKIRRARADTAG
jgi:PhnB protein